MQWEYSIFWGGKYFADMWQTWLGGEKIAELLILVWEGGEAVWQVGLWSSLTAIGTRLAPPPPTLGLFLPAQVFNPAVFPLPSRSPAPNRRRTPKHAHSFLRRKPKTELAGKTSQSQITNNVTLGFCWQIVLPARINHTSSPRRSFYEVFLSSCCSGTESALYSIALQHYERSCS